MSRERLTLGPCATVNQQQPWMRTANHMLSRHSTRANVVLPIGLNMSETFFVGLALLILYNQFGSKVYQL